MAPVPPQPVKVGLSVQYVNAYDDPSAAVVTKVHDTGRVCLVFWCNKTKTWKEAEDVAYFPQSDGDTNERYFTRLDDPDDAEGV
jgi:hypothetical protein